MVLKKKMSNNLLKRLKTAKPELSPGFIKI